MRCLPLGLRSYIKQIFGSGLIACLFLGKTFQLVLCDISIIAVCACRGRGTNASMFVK